MPLKHARVLSGSDLSPQILTILLQKRKQFDNHYFNSKQLIYLSSKEEDLPSRKRLQRYCFLKRIKEKHIEDIRRQKRSKRAQFEGWWAIYLWDSYNNNRKVMKPQIFRSTNNDTKASFSPELSPYRKTPTKPTKETIMSLNRMAPNSKLKQSPSELRLTDNDQPRKRKGDQSPRYDWSKDKKDKKAIVPTDKIIERVKYNLSILETKINDLFWDQYQEELLNERRVDERLREGREREREKQKEREKEKERVREKDRQDKIRGSLLMDGEKRDSKKRLEGKLMQDGRRQKKMGQENRSFRMGSDISWK